MQLLKETSNDQNKMRKNEGTLNLLSFFEMLVETVGVKKCNFQYRLVIDKS